MSNTLNTDLSLLESSFCSFFDFVTILLEQCNGCSTSSLFSKRNLTFRSCH